MGCGDCSSCCEVIGVDGFSMSKEKEYKANGSIPKGWRRISKRRAKKIKPYLFSDSVWSSSRKIFFTCDHLTDEGCSIHSESPYVCAGYPYYGRTLEEAKEYSQEYVYEYSNKGCNLYSHIVKINNEAGYEDFIYSNFKNFIDRFPEKLHKNRTEFSDRMIPVINL